METDNLSNDSQIPDSILCDSNKFPTNSVNEEKTSQIEIENNNIDDENDENVEMTISTNVNNKKGKVQNKTMEATEVRPCQFALGRIKSIMKMDPEMGLSSKESVFLIAKATELFVEFLAKETYAFTSQGSRKTIQRKDIDQAINSVDSLFFLDAALD